MRTKLPDMLITDNVIIQPASLYECEILKSISESWEERELVINLVKV